MREGPSPSQVAADRASIAAALARSNKAADARMRKIAKANGRDYQSTADDEDGAIDGEALLELDLPDVQYLCKPWIPEGVTILAGRPKIGKTTLLRQVSVCTASGAALWGSPCGQADVLFLSLEEGQKLMRKKLLSAGFLGSQVRRIKFHWKWRPGVEGVADIRAKLEAHPTIRLVIVDSLTRFQGRTDKGQAAVSSRLRGDTVAC